jgi:hypothetical protein
VVGEGAFHQAGHVDGAVRPGVEACEQGSGAWDGEVACGVVVVEDGSALGKAFEVRGGAARVAIEGEVAGAHGVEEDEDDVWPGWLEQAGGQA